ncbi:MAG TPA: peptidylprolyl isomerase [Nevskiaceae bacterium]|nr:peptidylprolyl isomerase [Nevskiaceae bacterium]
MFHRSTLAAAFVLSTLAVASIVPTVAVAAAVAPPASAASAQAAAPTMGTQPVVLDRIVAVVNQGVILQSQLVNEIAVIRARMKARGITPPPAKDLQGQVLEHMILMRIQLQRAEQAGIKVDDSEINEALTHLAKQNNTTPAQFLQAAAQQGIDGTALRHQVRDEITIEELRQKEVDQHIEITSQDVDLFLANQARNNGEQYHLSQILVAVPDKATPAQRAATKTKADKLLAELQHGGDFAQLAIRNSDGQQALKGGDLGWRNAADLPTIFAPVVPSLKVGGISGLITSPNGYHIVKLDGKRSTGPHQTAVENHAEHILLTPTPLRDEAATKALAEKLYNEIEHGASLKKLAEKYSDDTQSKDSGGDLGWQPAGVFVPTFQQHLDDLKPGQVSPPFRTRFGWHIVKLLGRRTVDVTDKMRRARARMAIEQQRETSAYQTWLQKLRADAYVSIRLKPGMITDADVAAVSGSAGS